MIGMFKRTKYTLSQSLAADVGWGRMMLWMQRASANRSPPPPSWLIPPRGTPLPLPAGFSRSLRHILSPHLSQHIKLSVLPQLHTRRCCHAKHRSARTPDCCCCCCWPARRGERVGRCGERRAQCGCRMSWIVQSVSLSDTPSPAEPVLKPFTEIIKQYKPSCTALHVRFKIPAPIYHAESGKFNFHCCIFKVRITLYFKSGLGDLSIL